MTDQQSLDSPENSETDFSQEHLEEIVAADEEALQEVLQELWEDSRLSPKEIARGRTMMWMYRKKLLENLGIGFKYNIQVMGGCFDRE